MNDYDGANPLYDEEVHQLDETPPQSNQQEKYMPIILMVHKWKQIQTIFRCSVSGRVESLLDEYLYAISRRFP